MLARHTYWHRERQGLYYTSLDATLSGDPQYRYWEGGGLTALYVYNKTSTTRGDFGHTHLSLRFDNMYYKGGSSKNVSNGD